ncbi:MULTISPECIES: (2Fe-2S)-binding protein [unclassified Streptomyces]|uniref:(2Fe-2S)-binding protein n=1 Tax=unclassified Streptomyces TaxID=2593676 RepID=UPI0033A81754
MRPHAPGGRAGRRPPAVPGSGATGGPGGAHLVGADVPARVSAIGPYFAMACGPRADADRFRPLTALYEDRAVLARYVAEVGRRLGTDQRRVAASTLHIGTAARLWSIALGTAALTGRVPDLAPERVWWRTPDTGPVDLWMPDAPEVAEGDVVDVLRETVVVRNLLPLGDAVRRLYGVSPHALRGNAASALLGAVRVTLAQAPDAPHSPLPLATALLEREPLAGAGTFDADSLTYRRRSCCLYYRVRGAGVCGDCVLGRERTRA